MAVKKTVTRSQEFSDSVIDTVREPLIVLNHDLRVVTASRSFYEFFKVKPEETVGQLIYDLGNKQWDIPQLRELLETILPEKTTFDDYEVEHNFAAIGRRIMLLNARQIQRESGKERIILLAIEDITERKQLEELLEASEERFRRLFETASDGIVLLEKREGRIIDANPATEKMLGYNKKESIGHKLPDIGISLDRGDFQKTMQNLNRTGILNYDDVPVETRSGKHIDTDIYLVDRARLAQCNIRDITKRKQAENMLRQQTNAMDSAIDGIAILNKDGKFVYLNKAHVKIYGYENEAELIGKSWRVLYDSEVIQRFEQDFMLELSRKGYWFGESIGTKKNGSKFPQSVSLTAMANGGMICVVRDISERKRAEEYLRENEERSRIISSLTSDIAYSCSTKEDGRLSIDWMIGATERISGYSVEEIMAQRCWSFLVVEEDLAIFEKNVIDLTPDSKGLCELRIRHKNGDIVWITSYAECFMATETPEHFLLYGALVDITERKQAEEELLQTNALLNSIIENIPDMIFLKDAKEFRFIRFNRAGEDLLGYSREEMLGKSDYDFFPKEQADLFTKKDREVLCGKEVVDIPEETIQTGNKGERIMHTKKVPLLNANGEPEYLLGISEDITERKRDEESLRKAEETYRLVVDNMAEGITVMDLNLRFIYVSPSIFHLRGYTVEEAMAQTLEQVMTPESLQLVTRVFEEELKLEAGGTADPGRIRIVELEEYRKDGSTVWLENHLSAFRDKENKLAGIIALSHDITERKQIQEELNQTLESLRKAFDTTIQVMISAIEVRDPYTAGHQIRSADLAGAIATEMGLDQLKIDGIKMAGSIHDIGKLSVPSEILSKPTKLTNIEFAMIKEHPRSGYEILKNVESPWQLAQVAYQHHERMDGSGYPRNLKGEEILMEARIMAVADVVEAMASHRPYRTALGIDAALEEIEKNKGILYDHVVADACLRLFRKKGYTLDLKKA